MWSKFSYDSPLVGVTEVTAGKTVESVDEVTDEVMDEVTDEVTTVLDKDGGN